jgi:hypothetical protein
MKQMKRRIGKDKEALKKTQQQLVDIATGVMADAQTVLSELESLLQKPDLADKLSRQLVDWLGITDQVVRQTEEVIKGNRHLPRRVVSMFDVEARPIKRGKSHVDTEFGRKVVIGETDHGIISSYEVLKDNPADTGVLKRGIKGHRKLFRKRLKAVAGDRGFYSQGNEDWLHNNGVTQVSIPKRGKISQERRSYQKQYWFRRLQRFRAGIEARISLLKRKFGLRRSRMRGDSGTQIWVGQGIFTHNLWQAARMASNL